MSSRRKHPKLITSVGPWEGRSPRGIFSFHPEKQPMALLALHRIKPHIRRRDLAKFPDDYTVVAHSTIDDNLIDHPLIVARRWFLFAPPISKTSYGRSTEMIDGKQIVHYLHRVVWETVNGPIPGRLQIDHADRNGLNNQIDNLRLATPRQQVWNRSHRKNRKYPYKGVRFRNRRWRAYIVFNRNRTYYLGVFDRIEEAAAAYDIVASRLFGEFAELNNISEDLVSLDKRAEIEQQITKRIPSPNYA